MVLVAQVLQNKVVDMVPGGSSHLCAARPLGRVCLLLQKHSPGEKGKRNLCSCCFSHRNDFCEPSLIGSDRLNQVNEDLLFKDWVPSQLT